MREIVVASGKGGTGKTSLVGSLAALSGHLVVVDCDVDAANLHLLIRHEIEATHDFSASRSSSIRQDDCLSCGLCEELCHFNAIDHSYSPERPERDIYRIEPLLCEGCGLCYHACPERAIDFQPVISGQWFRSESEFGPFLHGRLGYAQSNSGRLVWRLRQEATKIAAANGHDVIMIDGPPGIGCPVIAALTGATYLLIVTEPSLAAIHDLERLVQLAEHFGLTSGLCINKYDINEELSRQIEDYAGRHAIPVLARLAYDRGVVDAQVAGRPYVVYAQGENTETIKKMWHDITVSLTEEQPGQHTKFSV